MTTILTFKDIRNVPSRFKCPDRGVTIETLPVGRIKGTKRHSEKVENELLFKFPKIKGGDDMTTKVVRIEKE